MTSPDFTIVLSKPLLCDQCQQLPEIWTYHIFCNNCLSKDIHIAIDKTFRYCRKVIVNVINTLTNPKCTSLDLISATDQLLNICNQFTHRPFGSINPLIIKMDYDNIPNLIPYKNLINHYEH